MARHGVAVAKIMAAISLLLLDGCGSRQFWVLEPRGPVARASFHALLIDVGVMMLIIGPTTILLLWCLWRYRRSTGHGAYHPTWTQSLTIEILSWGFPLAIVAFLSVMSYRSSFLTNPFGPGAMAYGLDAANDRTPIDIDVVTTDWQWLFIYPGQHIASANELVVPVHTPIRLRMTSATVSNDIFIPQLMGQIDVMPGMLTKQGFVASEMDVYQGIATDFSGPGFSWMQFPTRVVSQPAFERWTHDVGQSPTHLDQSVFDRFATPTINKSGKPIYFSKIDEQLFGRIIADVMMGKTFSTPSAMTDKKSSQHNGRHQPSRASEASPPSDQKAHS